MQYVRRIEFDSAEISGDQGYKGQRREMHPDCYTGPPCDAIRIETIPITGAVAPSTYVVGQWMSIYKPIASFDEVARARTAINFLHKLRGHPHINPLDRVVVDAAGNIWGYTVPFLPMGTLEERRTLHSDWFLQLAKTADEINFTYVELL